nr:45 kda immunodominant polypeptide {N-terminal} [Theileria sergenti, merozoite, Korean isolate, host=cattle, Peptide Partial, 20 aa] [Theileria sergenti]
SVFKFEAMAIVDKVVARDPF